METKQIVENLLNQMQTGWNIGDGMLFAKPFAASSQFVDIRGTLHANASPGYLANAHTGLFHSIYKGSTVSYRLVHYTGISRNLVLANIDAALNIPAGPLAGNMESTISILVDLSIEDGKIISFHNTLKAK